MYLVDLNTKTNKKDLVSRKTRQLFFYRFHEIFFESCEVNESGPGRYFGVYSVVYFLFVFFLLHHRTIIMHHKF